VIIPEEDRMSNFSSKRLPLGILVLVALYGGMLTGVEPGKPSVTALETTAFRAIGARHPDPTIRNGDYLAERLLGTQERAILEKAGDKSILKALAMPTEAAWESFAPFQQRFATAVHSRTRHIDESVRESLELGGTQLVILGAGLDSRAYRFRNELGSGRAFEVDFPPTQEYKKTRIRAVLGLLPRHVIYVPIDFTKEELRTVLDRAGYDERKKSTFVWEGVSFYIPEDAVDATLRFVATHSAPGSRIVFDYMLESMVKNPTGSAVELLNRLAALKEPMIFGIPDEDRQGFITRRGLTIASDVGINDLRARFLPRQFATATAPSVSYVCTAVVPERAK
jgi:methyltransferase (TIGR00027 family)